MMSDFLVALWTKSELDIQQLHTDEKKLNYFHMIKNSFNRAFHSTFISYKVEAVIIIHICDNTSRPRQHYWSFMEITNNQSNN